MSSKRGSKQTFMSYKGIWNTETGEEIISSNGSVAVVIEITNSTQIGISYINRTPIQIGNVVTFQSSGIQATVSAKTGGDREISRKFELDPGQRPSFYDYSRIIRKTGQEPPTNRLKVVY